MSAEHVGPETTFDEAFDVVVVGSGAGAVCAALAVRDAGRSVVVLEKLPRFGGSTGYSAGIAWVPNNPLMAREGVEDSYERARAYFDAVVTYHGQGTSAARRRAFLETGPEVVSYLEGKGMRWARAEGFSDYYDAPGSEPRGRVLVGELFDLNELGAWKDRLSVFPGMPIPVGGMDFAALSLIMTSWPARRRAARIALRLIADLLRRRDKRGAGASLQGRLLQIALRYDIPIRLSTPVTDLLVEGDRVVGVDVVADGQRRRIGAHCGVLLNAGGFSRNQRMRETYGPHPVSAPWTMANPGDTGEMVESAMALGAATDCMDEAWWVFTSLGPGGRFVDEKPGRDGLPVPPIHHGDISLPHSILVDQDGNRFADEASPYMEKGQRMYERHRQTGRAIPAWAIMDRRHRRRYPWGPVPGPTRRKWLRTGYMKKAQTLDDLAVQCGIDGAGLRATVNRFNRFCATGVDEDYGRGSTPGDRIFSDPSVHPNPNLGSVEQAPFYAVAIYPSDIGMAGGLVTDEDGRVLREDSSPIDGLYATGNTTASVVGRVYPCGGASVAASMVFAYRAVRHAVMGPPATARRVPPTAALPRDQATLHRSK